MPQPPEAPHPVPPPTARALARTTLRNQLIQRLHRGFVHQTNNHLTVILGNLESPAPSPACIARAELAARRCASLATALILFQRGEAHPEPQPGLAEDLDRLVQTWGPIFPHRLQLDTADLHLPAFPVPDLELLLLALLHAGAVHLRLHPDPSGRLFLLASLPHPPPDLSFYQDCFPDTPITSTEDGLRIDLGRLPTGPLWLVDPDPDFADLLIEVLGERTPLLHFSSALDVPAAPSPRGLLAALQPNTLDLAVTLRAANPNLPCWFYTGRAGPPPPELAALGPPIRLLKKPFDLSLLHELCSPAAPPSA